MKLNKNIIKALYEAKEQKSGFTFDETERKDLESFLKSLGFKKDKPIYGGDSFSYTYGFNFEEPYGEKNLNGKFKTISASCYVCVNFDDKSEIQSDNQYDLFCDAQIGSDDYDRDGYPNFSIRYIINDEDRQDKDVKSMKDFKNKIKSLIKISDSIKDLAEEYVKAEKSATQAKNKIKQRLSKFKK